MVRRAATVRVGELTAGRVADAAALMAVEHAGSGVAAMTGFGDEVVCRRAMSDLLSDGYHGYAAFVDRELAGVMCVGSFPPVAFIPAHGLAIRVAEHDPTSIIVAMLGAATSRLLDEGVVRLTTDHIAAGPVCLALHDAGFGGGGVFAIRSTAPLPNRDTSVRVRTGTTADLDSIAEISHIELRYRHQPPVHSLEPERSPARTRELHAEMLTSGEIHLIASLHDQDVGLLTIEMSSPSPRLCPHGAHIGPTATRPDVRGHGVGTALVAAALDEARARGLGHISVDFQSANPLSRPFWTGLGFTPTGYRSRRVIRLT